MNRTAKFIFGLSVLVLVVVAISSSSVSQELTEQAEIEEEWTLEQMTWGEQTLIFTYETNSIPENTTAELEFEQVGNGTTQILSVNQDTLSADGLTVSGEVSERPIQVRVKFTFDGVDTADNFLTTKGILFRNPSPDITYTDGLVTYESEQKDSRTRSVSVNESVEYYTADQSTFTQHFLYIGLNNRDDPKKFQFTDNETTVTVYAPDYGHTNISESDINRIQTVFNHMQQTINTEYVETKQIQIATAPSTARNGGQTWDRRSTNVYVWGNEHQLADHTDPLFAHEFIHTYQKHTVGDDLEWWIEGSATYMSGMYTTSSLENPPKQWISDDVLHQGWYDHRDVRNQSYSKMSLADTSSWDHSFEYARGGRTVYLIDIAMREHTNGEKTIIDVFNWMNTQENVSYSEFRQYIAEETSPEFANRLDRYVYETEKINLVEEEAAITDDPPADHPRIKPLPVELEPYELPQNENTDTTIATRGGRSSTNTTVYADSS